MALGYPVHRIFLRRISMSAPFDTKVLKVDRESVQFSPNSHLNGALPSIKDAETMKALQHAASVISQSDDPVAFPTETVYGLGGSALNDRAVQNIYKAKNRPSDNPLITHVSSIDQLNRKIFNAHLPEDQLLKNVPEVYHSLIEKLWPGPLTIILNVPSSHNRLSSFTTGGHNTFALRIPSDPIARALIALSDTPIAAPSANASTRPSPTMASHVYHDLHGRIPLILDGGPCKVGVESTVVDGLTSPPMLLRPGGFTYEQIKQLGGEAWQNCRVENQKTLAEGEQVRTPGMKYKHYSPSAKVILLVPEANNAERSKYLQAINRIIGEEIKLNKNIKKIGILVSKRVGSMDTLQIGHLWNDIQILTESLGSTGEAIQTHLFALLRKLDEIDNVDLIIVEGISEDEEGLAVMNRLKKASGDNCVSI